MSGNTDFWHNDLFTGIGHPFLGNNLFGAERIAGLDVDFLAARLALVPYSVRYRDFETSCQSL